MAAAAVHRDVQPGAIGRRWTRYPTDRSPAEDSAAGARRPQGVAQRPCPESRAFLTNEVTTDLLSERLRQLGHLDSGELISIETSSGNILG